jgi:hypothetical protein
MTKLEEYCEEHDKSFEEAIKEYNSYTNEQRLYVANKLQYA